VSGIVGSRVNSLGSGPVGSLGTDGQAFLSSGAGVSATYETISGGLSVDDITGATALAEEPALTDELMISDGGTLKRVDATHFLESPMMSVGELAHLYFDPDTTTIVDWDRLWHQSGGTFGDTNYQRYTPGVAGWYRSSIQRRFAGNQIPKITVTGEYWELKLTKNGTAYEDRGTVKEYKHQTYLHDFDLLKPFIMIYLDVDDYVEVTAYHNAGESAALGQYAQWSISRMPGFGN
jgi:hypothetical protein